jgi:hypothetical protein
MAPSAYGASGAYQVPTPASESGNPFHPTKSPLIFALVFLFAGILMLQRAGMPLSLIPEHGAGPGMDVNETWSQAEQEVLSVTVPDH